MEIPLITMLAFLQALLHRLSELVNMPVSYYKAAKYINTVKREREAAEERQNTEGEIQTTGIDVWHKPEAHYLWWVAEGKRERDTEI